MFAKATENLKLPQWQPKDHPDFLTDMNKAFRDIDSAYSKTTHSLDIITESVEEITETNKNQSELLGQHTKEISELKEDLEELDTEVGKISKLKLVPLSPAVSKSISNIKTGINILRLEFYNSAGAPSNYRELCIPFIYEQHTIRYVGVYYISTQLSSSSYRYAKIQLDLDLNKNLTITLDSIYSETNEIPAINFDAYVEHATTDTEFSLLENKVNSIIPKSKAYTGVSATLSNLNLSTGMHTVNIKIYDGEETDSKLITSSYINVCKGDTNQNENIFLTPYYNNKFGLGALKVNFITSQNSLYAELRQYIAISTEYIPNDDLIVKLQLIN